jgi:hypothetical protein
MNSKWFGYDRGEVMGGFYYRFKDQPKPIENIFIEDIEKKPKYASANFGVRETKVDQRQKDGDKIDGFGLKMALKTIKRACYIMPSQLMLHKIDESFKDIGSGKRK